MQGHTRDRFVFHGIELRTPGPSRHGTLGNMLLYKRDADFGRALHSNHIIPGLPILSILARLPLINQMLKDHFVRRMVNVRQCFARDLRL